MLDQGGAAVGLPAARLEHKEGFERASHIVRRRRDLERDWPVLGETIVLPAQFLQLLGSKRVAQQLFGIGRGVETGALFGAQHDGAQGPFPKARLRAHLWPRPRSSHGAARWHGRRLRVPAPAGRARHRPARAPSIRGVARSPYGSAETSTGSGSLKARQAETTGNSAVRVRAVVATRTVRARRCVRARMRRPQIPNQAGSSRSARSRAGSGPASRPVGARAAAEAHGLHAAPRPTDRGPCAQSHRSSSAPHARRCRSPPRPVPRHCKRTRSDAGRAFAFASVTLDETIKDRVRGELQMPPLPLTVR